MHQKGQAILIVLLIAAAISGYLVYSGKINLPQKQTTQQTTETSKVDETTNRKTYTNQEFKFSFKYPEDWTIKEETDPRRAFGLMSVMVSAPTKQTFLDIVVQSGTQEQIEKELGSNAAKDKIGNITVWVQKTGEVGKVYSFPSIVDGQTINFVYGAVSDSPKLEVQALDQILSTFKFLDQK